MLTNIREILSGAVERSLVRLWSGRLTSAEAAAMRSRAATDAKYRKAHLETLEALAGMEELAGDDDIRAIAADTRSLIEARRRNRQAALGLAASMLLGAGLAAIYALFMGGGDGERLEPHVTRVGEQKTLELADGSVVTLNTDTRLVVDYGEFSRRILLEQGEAFFEVARDPARPFSVELGARSVTALGTAFNIHKRPERYQLAVLEGKVAMHPASDEALAGGPAGALDAALQHHRVEQGWVAEFEVGHNRLTTFQPESMERYLGWRQGMVRFYREPLHRVVRELNRYTRKKISIEDPAVMEMSVYAAVSIRKLHDALAALEQLLPIEVTERHDRIVITGSPGKAPARTSGS